jgi:sugar/nucleoside kinase (ribokinase family)
MVAETCGTTEFIGGAYPVAADLAQFCGEVTLVSNCTGDPEQAGIRHVSIGTGPQTVRKTRFVGSTSGEILFFLCEWPDDEAWTAALNLQREACREAIRSSDVTVVLDYGHGLINAEFANDISLSSGFLALNCQANGGRHPFNLISKYPAANLVVLNEYEARLNAGVFSAASPTVLARQLSMDRAVNQVVVTSAAHGAWLCQGFEVLHQRSFATNIIDTVGCGDALLGFAALASASGWSPALILELGSLAAAAKARMRVHEHRITDSLLRETYAIVAGQPAEP